MGRMSRNKGKVGEREAAKELTRVLGVDASRGRQFQGSDDSPDVRTSLHGTHFEVKRVEALQLYPAMQQATDDAGANVPVVLHRKNNKPWLVVVRLDDLPRLAEKVFLQLASVGGMASTEAGER